jgi:hypothetical protein
VLNISNIPARGAPRLSHILRDSRYVLARVGVTQRISPFPPPDPLCPRARGGDVTGAQGAAIRIPYVLARVGVTL